MPKIFRGNRNEDSGPDGDAMSKDRPPPAARSIKVAWTITVIEAMLLGAAVWVLADYWLMLPVRLRVLGVVGLAGFGLFCVIRLVRFYVRAQK